MDKDKKPHKTQNLNAPEASSNSAELDALYQKLQSEMRRPRPGQDAMAAAMEAVRRLAEETASESVAEDLAGDGRLCRTCGHRNRGTNKFCSMCGLPVEAGASEPYPMLPELPRTKNPFADENYSPHASQESAPVATPPSAQPGTHHYHHHYHHHYFQAGQEVSGIPARSGSEVTRDTERPRSVSPLRGDPLRGEAMSRAETAVRRITQDWMVSCNTKHLDDLLELYSADALVLRSNYPPVRGAAAIREFFFSALDAGLGEVELDPIRLEVLGDVAYEAGRCKALVPGALGKRREERGKYLWVFTRQPNGEWKLASDCWSSDLTLGGESDVPAQGKVVARKTP